jgi:phosphoenolpyruvate carboxylase
MGDMKHLTAPAPAKREKDNERPLVEDIRLLGRILGDEIREQEGPAAFELIEKIRTLSVAFRRDADHEADKALKVRALPATRRCGIRAFTWLPHLANLAEDHHHIRRRAVTNGRRHTRAA